MTGSSTPLPVYLRSFPAQPVLSRTERATAAVLDAIIEENVSILRRHAETMGAVPDGAPIVLYHGDVDATKDGPVEICLPVNSETAKGIMQLPATEAMVAEARGEACDFPAILSIYGAIMDRIAEQGLMPGSPGREIHLEGGGDRHILIAMPVVRSDRSA